VFQGTGELLLETVRHGVRGAAPRAVVTRLQREPVVGAALLALEEN
jgi:hypothetical protein